MTKVSVIIPTLNEADYIDDVLDHALAPEAIDPDRVLVVDGGSADGTLETARQRVPALRSPAGRARQMNTGAAQADGDVLLFCHGDSLLPDNYPQAIARALRDPSVVGGAFTPTYEPGHPWFTAVRWLLRLPSNKLFFGDSALFFRRSDFEAIQGYPEIPIMEDIVLVEAISSRGRLMRLPEPVITSARRFHERGVFRQLLLDFHLLVDYHLFNRSPTELAPRYWRTERDPPREE